MEQWTGSKLGKEYDKAEYCNPAYLIYMQSTSYEILGWMSHKLESRFLGEYQKPQICKWYHSNGWKWRGNKKSLLKKVKEESKKAGLKLNINKTKIMVSGPITSWQLDGEKVEQWQIFFSWAPKSLWTVTAALKLKDACSFEEKPGQT